MANQRIKANLIPSYDMINHVIHLAQYDVSDGTGKQVEIELYYGADKYTIPSGSTVTFRGTKRDKTGYSYEITKFTDNVVTVDVKSQMTALSGTHNAELRITNGHTISNTIKFVMDIESSALADDTKVSETKLPTIEKASQAYDFCVSVQGKVEEAKASAESAIQTKAEVEQLKKETVEQTKNLTDSAKQEISTVKDATVTEVTELKNSTVSEITSLKGSTIEAVTLLKDNAKAEADRATESSTSAKVQAEEAKASAESVANVVSDVSKLKEDLAANTSNITKNANDIKTLQEDLSSVGQQADANTEAIDNLTNTVNDKFIKSGLGVMKTGKLYGVKIWKSSSNNSQTLEKTRDNAGLVCVPSTDTTVGQDDYADIPLFQWVRCNYKRYDDGFAYPIAIEGDGNYKETGDVDCGAIQPTFWYGYVDSDEYEELIISDSPNNSLGLKPWEQAVRADGTVMPYFINSCYHSVTGSDGLLHSMKGKIARNQCHNNMITNYQKKGAGYWGAGSDRYTFAQIMMFIKYGTKSIQKVMAGVTSHNVQIKASIQSEEANTYFPVTNSQASSILVGTRFSVGYGTFNSSGTINIDRENGTIHRYADDVLVTAKVPMDDGANTAIYLDCTAFNTMPITDSNGYTSDIYLTSMHALSGDTDSVIGHHDGSPYSNTDGKHPCRIQGIEFMLGGYTVASDTVMFFKSDYSKDVYVAPRGIAHSPSDSTIQSTYTLVGNIPANNAENFWIGDVNHVNGVWYPSTVVSSDQYGMGDRCYAGGQSTSGSREYLQGGSLLFGSNAGLSFLHCWAGLGGSGWRYLSAD